MKKKIFKITLALAVVLTGFLNSAKFTKMFSGDVSLNGLFNMAVAEGEECWQYDGPVTYIYGTDYYNGQTGWTEDPYDDSHTDYTPHGCYCSHENFGIGCDPTWENSDCDWWSYIEINCGGSYVG